MVEPAGEETALLEPRFLQAMIDLRFDGRFESEIPEHGLTALVEALDREAIFDLLAAWRPVSDGDVLEPLVTSDGRKRVLFQGSFPLNRSDLPAYFATLAREVPHRIVRDPESDPTLRDLTQDLLHDGLAIFADVTITSGDELAAVVWLGLERVSDGTAEQLRRFAQCIALSGREIFSRSRLRQFETRFNLLFNRIAEPMYFSDREGRLLTVNPAFRRLFGLCLIDTDEIDARDLYADPDDRGRFLARLDDEGSLVDYEVGLKTWDGAILDCAVTASVQRSADGRVVGYQGIVRDVTEEKTVRRDLEHRALYDPLTELPNRHLFESRMGRALRHSGGRGEGLAVVFLDVDNLKRINDSLGHVAGDRMLAEIGQRLHAGIREDDTVARLGGDEFVGLLVELNDLQDAEEAVTRILSQLD